MPKKKSPMKALYKEIVGKGAPPRISEGALAEGIIAHIREKQSNDKTYIKSLKESHQDALETISDRLGMEKTSNYNAIINYINRDLSDSAQLREKNADLAEQLEWLGQENEVLREELAEQLCEAASWRILCTTGRRLAEKSTAKPPKKKMNLEEAVLKETGLVPSPSIFSALTGMPDHLHRKGTASKLASAGSTFAKLAMAAILAKGVHSRLVKEGEDD